MLKKAPKSPPPEEGWTRHQTLERRGRGGQKQCLTTPSAPVAERGHFLHRRSHPSSGGGDFAACLNVLLIFCFSVVPLFAHHSTARYDLTKTVVVQGTVTEVIWQNPHVILVMNDTKGKEQAFEAPSPTYIVTSGWARDTIKPGDKVTVKGNPARNGELPMYLVTVTLANGKEYSPKNPERP